MNYYELSFEYQGLVSILELFGFDIKPSILNTILWEILHAQ